MKPVPGALAAAAAAAAAAAGEDHMMYDDGERELLEGIEGASVQEKLVDSEFFNRFEDDFDEDDMALPK
jgi:hypothetical protein